MTHVERSNSQRGGIGWRGFVFMLLFIVAAVVVGVIFAQQLRSGWHAVGQTLGLAHEHTAAPAITANAQHTQYYTCGMHPWVILPEPGLCPVCHMDLVPLDASKLRGEIAIDPVVVQNIGVRVAAVTTGPVAQHLRTVGTVDFDERTVRDINTKIAGWIESLDVDAEGETVDVGDPLFELYSPELYQAQEEYLLAWRARNEARGANDGFDLLTSARTRLEYFDISDDQIKHLEQTGTPEKTLTIRSPFKGVVTDKHATAGMRIEPGMRLYQIADLSTVWVNAPVYEHQLALVAVGQPAQMTLPFLPGKVFEGRVAYVYPYLDERSRQARIRIEFANERGALKPGMFATVELTAVAQQDAVLAPRESVITTGARRVAFVSLGNGRFEPRDVKTGVATEGKIQILEGLAPGELVVTSGQFLLDSESRMREALAKMVTGELASEQVAHVASAPPATDTTLPIAAQQQLEQLLSAYLDISFALTNDSTGGIAANAAKISAALEQLVASPPTGAPRFWQDLESEVDVIKARAQQLTGDANISEARVAFGHLSDALDHIVSVTGVPIALGAALDRHICGMAPDVPRAGVWLQRAGEDSRNPYFGAMMLRCNSPDQQRRLPTMDAAYEGDAP